MMLFQVRTIHRILAFTLIFCLGGLFSASNNAYGIHGGPSQPEFSSFVPASTSEMVNLFTGDFTYNLPIMVVPGPEGSSFPINLAYQSGIGADQQASWVGLGWTLNPGAINRQVQGFPDDYKGANVIYHNKRETNYSLQLGAGASLSAMLNFEAFGADVKQFIKIFTSIFGTNVFSPGGSYTRTYNSGTGFGFQSSASASLLGGIATFSRQWSPGESYSTWSTNFGAALIMNRLMSYGLSKFPTQIDPFYLSTKRTLSNVIMPSSYAFYSTQDIKRPVRSSSHTSKAVKISLGVQGNPFALPVGATVDAFGNYNTYNTVAKEEYDAFGYMYNGLVNNSTDLMDYSLEREIRYRDKLSVLEIPFSAPDYFVCTGNDVAGGFRIFQKNIGDYRPNKVEGNTDIFQAGGEVSLGPNFGAGLDVKTGEQKTSTDAWVTPNTFGDLDQEDEGVIFKFKGDKGGNWLHDSGDGILAAQVNKSAQPSFNINRVMNQGLRSKRSSFIKWNKNQDLINPNSNPYQSFTVVRNDINQWVNRNLAPEGIGTLEINNEEGKRYVYGLPVYTKNFKSINYGLKSVDKYNAVENRKFIYQKDAQERTKIGEEKPYPYAYSYLLTDILSKNYVDRTMNGPSKDDFGAYTRLNYKKPYGDGQSQWFVDRVPYNGLHYMANSLSDARDDLGSMTQSEKEVYFVQSIETKSHVAIFTTADRNDGLASPLGDAAINEGAKGSNKLQKLTKIALYRVEDATQNETTGHWSPNPGVTAIQEVDFNYWNEDNDASQQLCKGLVNGVGDNTAKLTLKSIHFTHHGVEDKSPYVFKYAYPTSNEAPYPQKYSALQQEYQGLADQNPDYNRYLSDGWGFYQKNGAQRHSEMKTWVDQVMTSFDPAAWHLKVIELPSGGQIHVQYEQKDYSYVQNRPVQVMTSITSKMGNRYYLNTTGIGVNTTAEKETLVKLIKDAYINDWRKMYFKFLYNLSGDAPTQIQNCNAEYITGYAKIINAGIEGGQVYVEIPVDEEYTPEKVCRDFYITQRRGHISTNCNTPKQFFGGSQNAENLFKSFQSFFSNQNDPGACKHINIQQSYFRVPTPISKKGGGVRVKRLLTYDKGIEGGPVLYGKEYHYIMKDDTTKTIRSSGVAVNEPSSFREENALVDADIDPAKTIDAKIVGGDIQKEFEGPLGENLLPGPSIGYRKVTVTDIHTGKSTPGFTVHEYNTAKDYPFEYSYNKMDREPYIDKGKTDMFFITLADNQKVSQGFVFRINEMHGKPKSQHTYGGIINSPEDLGSLEGKTASASAVYEYYPYYEPIPVMESYTGAIEPNFIGKEMEVNVSHKAIKDHTFDKNIEMDYTLSLFGVPPFVIPIPIVTAVPSFLSNENDYYCHVTSKVIQYPTFTKSVTKYKDGIKHIDENIAFDTYTGRPILVKSYDEHKGIYLQQQIPATWEYEGVRNKSINEGMSFNNLLNYFQEGEKEYLKIAGDEATVCEAIDNFYKGDVLDLGNQHLYHIRDVDKAGNEITIERSQLHNGGNPGALIAQAEILRSGLSNELKTSVGGITFHSDEDDFTKPVISDDDKIEATPFTSDLNAALAGVNGNDGLLSLLPGIYTFMDVAAFAGNMDFNCLGDLASKNIKDVQFSYEKENGTLSLNLLSFWIECEANQWEKVEEIGN